jgi:hypothetical protein
LASIAVLADIQLTSVEKLHEQLAERPGRIICAELVPEAMEIAEASTEYVHGVNALGFATVLMAKLFAKLAVLSACSRMKAVEPEEFQETTCPCPA